MKLDEIKRYKTQLAEEKAWKLIRAHCKDALKDFETPIVRGMSGLTNGFGLIHGAAGERTSKNTTNYYTLILDSALPALGFPKRSASIICANWENRDHAFQYGRLHAIIPYDGVKIGVCPYEDIFDSEVKLGNRSLRLPEWNDTFERQGISDQSFEEIVEDLEEMIDNGSALPWLKKIGKGNVARTLKEQYSKQFKLTTTKEAAYNDGSGHEVWIGGKCVAIDMRLYKKMMDNPPEDITHLRDWEPDERKR